MAGDHAALLYLHRPRRPVEIAWVARLLIPAKDASALLMQGTLTYQFVDRLGRLEGRIELYEGVGPEQTLIEASLYLLINTCILDADKASGVGSIIAYEAVAQLKYIQ